jgi:chromosome segregation ATPase
MDILQELDALKADYKAANELLETTALELTNLKETLAAKDSALANANETIAGKLADYETAKARIAELEANQKSAEEKAVEIVAAQGIKPMKVDVTSESCQVTKAEALAKYGELLAVNPVEAAKYYAANKATILGS